MHGFSLEKSWGKKNTISKICSLLVMENVLTREQTLASDRQRLFQPWSHRDCWRKRHFDSTQAPGFITLQAHVGSQPFWPRWTHTLCWHKATICQGLYKRPTPSNRWRESNSNTGLKECRSIAQGCGNVQPVFIGRGKFQPPCANSLSGFFFCVFFFSNPTKVSFK